jgi:hypothetical protein
LFRTQLLTTIEFNVLLETIPILVTSCQLLAASAYSSQGLVNVIPLNDAFQWAIFRV